MPIRIALTKRDSGPDLLKTIVLLGKDKVLKRTIIFFCCLFSFLMALGSKENAAILPISLILVEICFFQDLGKPGTRKAFGLGFLVGVFLLIVLGTLFMSGNPLAFLQAYENRPFTLCQRLMTEPRVLVFYLTQIFYPVPTRLSIEHDISISTSLLQPWTTIPSMVIIFVLIGLSFSQMKKRPILGFGILILGRDLHGCRGVNKSRP